MCGRFFTDLTWSELHALYALNGTPLNLRARYNIAPTQDVEVVRLGTDGKRYLSRLRWGLIPAWAKDAKGPPMFNARADTITEKPSFREAFVRRRCIVPASGWYEWQQAGKAKRPHLMMRKDGTPLAMAGIWESWTDKATGEVIESVAIVTTEANDLCAAVHDRMPVLLDPADFPAWLGEGPATPRDLLALLKPYPPDALEIREVGPRIGNVRNDDADLIKPAERTDLFF